MGGAQSYQWATQYPDFMDIVVPFCTSAKTSLHNQVFTWSAEEKDVGLKALGRVYAGW
jgi:homoserine O-acetyltransferase